MTDRVNGEVEAMGAAGQAANAAAEGAQGDGGAEDRGSRRDERIQTLLQRDKERDAELALLREKMAFLEGRAAAQSGPKEKPIDEIEDPEERVQEYLRRQDREIRELKAEREREKQERAHASMLSSAMRGLKFGDESAAQDAEAALSAYARNHSAQEVRAFAERMANRFNQTKEPTAAEKKAAEDKAYAERKAAEAKALRRPEAEAPAAASTVKPDARPKSSAELFADARASFLAAEKAKREAV